MARLKFLKDAVAVTNTEFRQLRRNRTAILVSLVIIPFFFTSALGGANGQAGARFSPSAQIPIAFIDNDLSAASGSLFETLATSGDFNHLIQGYREENALAALGTGRIYAAIVVPKGFQDKLRAEQTVTITLYSDDSALGFENPVLSALQARLLTFNPNSEMQVQTSPLTDTFPQIQIIRKGILFSGFAVGITVVSALVIVFATFYEIAGGMSRESEEGTYARLLVSPISLGAIMIGKTFYDSALNVIRIFIVLGFATFAYGARLNTDLGTVLAVSLLLALLTMGFAFMISALGLGVRSVVIIEFFLVLFLFAFSGFMIDRELLRGISKTISILLPWSYGIEVSRATMLTGQPLLHLARPLLFVGVSIAAFYIVSYLLLRLSRERLIK